MNFQAALMLMRMALTRLPLAIARGLTARLRDSTRALAALLTLMLAATVFQPANAAYVQVFSTIQKGAITFTGNTLMLNGTTGGSGVPGTGGTGGAFIAAGSTGVCNSFPAGTTCAWQTNASSATLNVPIGASVLYAELIWSGTNGALTAAQQNTPITLLTPTGSNFSVMPSGLSAGNSGTYYTRSANVTGYVQLSGSGTYTARGIPAGSTGASVDAAGWTLAVAYADPSQPARNLTIFVGAEQAGAAPAAVSGFCTPLTGPVNGRLMVSALEGDAGIAGDTMLFGPSVATLPGRTLFGSNNLVNNFFAGQINGNTGTLDTSGSFGTSNNPPGGNTSGARQGYDITNVDVSPRLSNSQTTAFAQGTTTGDNYAINALAMQINVTSPVFPVSVKNVNKTSTFVGDTLRYSINLDNTAGNGAANNVTFFDAIPPGMTLVPNSVTVNGTMQPGADPASGIPISNIPVGAVVTVVFDVTVTSLPASPAPARFDNSARWTYTYTACAGVLTQPGEVITNSVSTPAPRLEPVKSVSPSGQLIAGQTASYAISVPNTGLLDTAGSTLADPIPATTAYVPGSTRLNGVLVPDGAGGAMPFASAALISSPGRPAGVIAVGASATVQFQITAQTGGTVQNVASIDPDGAGPGTSLTVSAVNSGFGGPAVSKAFLPASMGASGISRLTVTLSNANPGIITGVTATDNLPAGMTIATPPNAATTCVGGSAAAAAAGTNLILNTAQIPASGSCTFAADVTAQAAGSYTNTIPAGGVQSVNAGVSTSGSQTLTVTQSPSVSKSFTPATVAPNAQSSLTITLANPTGTAMTAATVTDLLPNTGAGAPGNMSLFDTVTSNTCGGTLTNNTGAALAVGSTSVRLNNGVIPANNICSITVNVRAPVGGTYFNTLAVGALTTSAGANTQTATASLQVASPQISKSFASSTVAASAPTSMTVTLTNVTNAAITALAFTDTYPAGLVNSNNTVINTGCNGTATASVITTNPGTLTLSGGTLLAGASCTLAVNVQSAASGSYTNTIPEGGLSSSIGANAVAASATLNVAQPDISKAFGSPTLPLNGTTLLTITLTNPTATAMTGAAFTDTLPAGLTSSAAGGTCAGTRTASGTAVALTGGTLPAQGSCTVTATVTGTTVGLKDNIIPIGRLTVAGPVASSNGAAATASTSVLALPTLAKSFSISPILPNTGVSTLAIELFNSNSVALTNVTFTDTFPTSPGAMTIANLTTTNSCAGTLGNDLNTALAVGSAGVRLNGGTIPSNTSCSITVNVRATTAGDYTNTIVAAPGGGALSTLEAGGNALAASASLSVRLAAPALTKSFSPGTTVANAPTTLTLTITNSSTTQAITSAALSDIFPSGMKVFSTPGFTNTCGGTVSSGKAANDGSIGISGATIPFNAAGTGSCTISVQVTSTLIAASPGVTNTTGTVTSTNANTSTTASANLIVTAPPLTPPTIAKSFGPASIGSGDTSTITFTLGSSNTGILTNANFTDSLVNMSVASATIGGSCAGVANSPALAVGATALNLTVPNLAPGGCTVTVEVTSSRLGVNPNTVSGVTTTQTPVAGAGAGPVNLTVRAKPTITKAFGTPSIPVGGTSTIVFTLGNSNAVALTNARFTDTLTNMSISAATIAGSCAAVTNSPALAVGATGTDALNLTVPSLPAGGCTVIVTVTSTVSGTHPNSVSGVSTTETPTAGVGAGPVNLTVTGGDLSGFVYGDANHNSQKEIAENGTGLVLYAKLVPAASPTGPAQQAVAVDPATGAYQISGVAPGTYNVVIDDNATLADITPTLPAGWTGTEAGNQTRSNVVVGSNPLQSLNFGLFNGTRLTGRVFTDSGAGAGSGMANDGVQNGTEAGRPSVPVKLTDAGGATTYDNTVTDGSGNYMLWLPGTLAGASLRVVAAPLSGAVATGGSAGTTSGTYSRPTSTTAFSYGAGTGYSGVNFGVVTPNTLSPNGAQSTPPGTVVFYPHVFTAGSGGQVSFTLTGSATPAAPAWGQVLYLDANCNGLLEATELQVSGPLVVTTGQRLCLVLRQFVPADAPQAGQNVTTLSAVMSYANAAPALTGTLTAVDVTTVGQAGALTLGKLVNNMTQGGAAALSVNAAPGDTLQYSLNAVNNGAQNLTTLMVNDMTPAFTTYQSAACPVTLPAGITTCSVTTQPSVGGQGALQWTFTGSLASGAQLTVSYLVRVNQ